MQNYERGVLHCSAIRSIEWVIFVANFTTLRNTQRENDSSHSNSLFAVNTITINKPIQCITRSYVLTMPAHRLQWMNSWANGHSLSFRDGISLHSIRTLGVWNQLNFALIANDEVERKTLHKQLNGGWIKHWHHRNVLERSSRQIESDKRLDKKGDAIQYTSARCRGAHNAINLWRKRIKKITYLHSLPDWILVSNVNCSTPGNVTSTMTKENQKQLKCTWKWHEKWNSEMSSAAKTMAARRTLCRNSAK